MSIEVREIPSRDEWLQWRKSTLGASELPVILGLSPFATPFQLWARKRGEAREEESAIMERGLIMEPAILGEVKRRTGLKCWQPSHWYVDRELRLSCTPDAFYCVDPRGVIECKCVAMPEFDKHWIDETGCVVAPLHYRLQALATAKLTGAVAAHIAVLAISSFSHRFEFLDIPLDAAADESWDICKRAASAWWDRADKGLAPEPDYRLDGDAIRQLYRGGGPVIDLSGNNRAPELLAERETERQWISGFRADAKPHEQRLAEIENELKALLGDAECALLPGWEITWKSYERKAVPATTCRRFSAKRVNGDAR